MRSVRWVWLGPLAFLVHDAEEVLVYEEWVGRNAAALPAAVRPLAESVDTWQVAAAALALLIGYIVASTLGARALRAGRRPWLYLVITGAFVANGLTHVIQAAVFGGYTPGVVTASLIVLPYGWAAGRALVADRIVTGQLFLALIGAGALLQVPIIGLALKLFAALP